MAIKKDSGFQDASVKTLTIAFGDPTAFGTAENAIELPIGATVTNGDIIVDTAFNSTTNTLTIGDVTVPTRYAAAVDLKTAARTVFTLTGFKTTATQRFIQVNVAQTGGIPTAGSVRVNVHYIVDKRVYAAVG